MAKRNATSDLNHENWDREEDPEEAGSFQKASEDSLKTRVIKVAKRRNPIGSMQQGDREKSNVFGTFTGFSKTPAAPPTSNSFSFLSNIVGGKTEDKKELNGTENKTNSSSSSSNSTNSKSSTNGSSNSDEYYAKLKGLNESVSEWIRKHVSDNPFVNLQPIFKDYDKYYAELEKIEKDSEKSSEKPSAAAATSVPQFNFSTGTGSSRTANNKPLFQFGATNKASTASSTNNTTTTTSGAPLKFNFGSTTTSSNTSVTSSPPTTTTTAVSFASGFSFGNNSATTGTTGSLARVAFSHNSPTQTSGSSTATLLSFGDSSKTSFTFSTTGSIPTSEVGKFSFGGSSSLTSSKPILTSGTDINNKPTEEENNDESDEPPKVEFTPVVEEGHVYTVRCKVFVKKDGTFGDRGVGNLYLKPIPNKDKFQLIVRADTNLGNLLCNFILSENVPTQRMGKRDVMLVCLPTPETQPPPVPILLRVKTPEDADELLKTLEKYKK